MGNFDELYCRMELPGFGTKLSGSEFQTGIRNSFSNYEIRNDGTLWEFGFDGYESVSKWIKIPFEGRLSFCGYEGDIGRSKFLNFEARFENGVVKEIVKIKDIWDE